MTKTIHCHWENRFVLQQYRAVRKFYQADFLLLSQAKPDRSFNSVGHAFCYRISNVCKHCFRLQDDLTTCILMSTVIKK